MIERSLDKLRSPFREQAATFVHILRDDLGIDARVTETLRDRSRQAELAAGGKSMVRVGFHNFGLALDFIIFDDWKILRDDATGLYTRCGHVAKALGWRWGGDWVRLRDDGHVESAEFALADLIAAEEFQAT